MAVQCPVCSSLALVKGDERKDVDCFRCGRFSITRSGADIWAARNATESQVSNACGWLRERQGIYIDTRDLDALGSVSPPTVAERADKLLRALQSKTATLGQHVPLENSLPAICYWMGISWSSSFDEVKYLIDLCLVPAGQLIRHGNTQEADRIVSVTPGGYARLHELRQKSPDTVLGFCAMWFDPALNSLWTDAIAPAIRDAGYEPKRIDHHEHNNKIDDEIIVLIRKSRFVVADYTGNRGGVYFEAGLALGLDIPVFWTCLEPDLPQVHFDTRQYNFVLWKSGELTDFKDRLQNRIVATIGAGPIKTTN